MKLAFSVPLPPREARGNNKPQTVGQRYAKREALFDYAEAFKYAAIDARNKTYYVAQDPMFLWKDLGSAHMTVTWVFPDRRRRDVDNYNHALKGCQDSLVAIGLLQDDCWTHLTVTYAVRVEKGISRVDVEIEA